MILIESVSLILAFYLKILHLKRSSCEIDKVPNFKMVEQGQFKVLKLLVPRIPRITVITSEQ